MGRTRMHIIFLMSKKGYDQTYKQLKEVENKV